MPSSVLKSLQLDSIDFDDDLKSLLKTEFFNSIDFYFNVSLGLGLGLGLEREKLGLGLGLESCYTIPMHTHSLMSVT